MNTKYILNKRGVPVVEPDLIKWGLWFERSRSSRIVKQETVGDTFVSTVFLGLDHSWGKGPPVLWETMCFHGKKKTEMDRCSGSLEQAEAMHERMVKRVKESNERRKTIRPNG